jgi:hypothetical protein
MRSFEVLGCQFGIKKIFDRSSSYHIRGRRKEGGMEEREPKETNTYESQTHFLQY